MKHFYAEDLDELIEYRSDHFVEKHLPAFTISDIEGWNKFNEDMGIMPFNESYPLNHVAQEPFFNAAEGHKVDYRVVYTKIEIEHQPYVLMSRIAMIEPGDLMLTLTYQYGILFFILIVSFAVIQRTISKRLWKPFYDSLGKIEQFDLEKGNAPQFEKTNTKEFVRLNDNLDRLIKSDLEAYNQQKEFIENASHELQTPLAVFQSQLDLLLQNPDLTEAQGELIQSLYNVSSRLTRLNKNLLLLAKIDNAQFKDMQAVDFNLMLQNQLPYLRDLAEDSGIAISVNISNPLSIMANKTLVESLVSNIIVNAIRHNIANGSIDISVENKQLSVSNSGEGTPLDPHKIFKRFSRTSEEKKGNGLGLSIAYRICKAHGWEITYDFKDERHRFTVDFGK